MSLIIGSAALYTHFPGTRLPKDIDAYSPENYHDLGIDTFWHSDLEPWLGDDKKWHLASPDTLYTIKVSHSYWVLKNNSWNKHVWDLLFLKRQGARLIPEIHDLLYKIWEDTHGKKRVNLDMDKQAFFDDAVPRRYDHDSIHYSVAYGSRPVYEKVLKEGQEVKMDMTAVKRLPFVEQILLFREEICATALERFLIPNNYRYSPQAAYLKALRKTITSLTKGWSAQFIVENYDTFSKPDPTYLQRHLEKKHLLIPLGV